MPTDRPKEVKDITWQLVNNDPGRRAKVVMGGGRSSFLPQHQQDDRLEINLMYCLIDCFPLKFSYS